MITMENMEKPIVTVVKHSNIRFATAFPFLIVANSPQKQRASSTTMKNMAPVLNGSDNEFTKNRSV